MDERQDIDVILRGWEYQPGVISARIVQAADGREIYQMRIELGVLQLESTGRPDGLHPHEAPTYFDWIRQQADQADEPFVLTEEQCFEVDREFLQYYHRRICCLALRQFGQAVADADHTLAMMEFIVNHSPDPQWTASHEQYRPFVLFHKTQAATMVVLENSGAEGAIEELENGLKLIREVFAKNNAEDDFEQDELVGHLRELKESLRNQYHVGPTLAEQLAEAVAAEQYERAARLRDEIANRNRPKT
jgi:hypothetical protein